MTDDLKDIDPEIVEAVLANADAFIDADKRVDEIIAWGESELKSRRATESVQWHVAGLQEGRCRNRDASCAEIEGFGS